MIARQVASDHGYNYVDIRALLLDPVDLRGIPWRDEDGRTRWAPPVFLPPTASTALWLLNLEELASCVPMVQAALYQLSLERKCGEYELPEGASIIACSNRENDRGIVHRIEDYPSKEDLQGKFAIRYRITPVPDADHFIAQLATYTVTRADVGKRIRVWASFTDATATFETRASEVSEAASAVVPMPQGFVFDTGALSVDEGGSTAFTVRLAVDPGQAVTAVVNREGTAHIDVSPAQLSFNESNWSVPQTVTVNGKAFAGASSHDTSVHLTSSRVPTSQRIGVHVRDTGGAGTDWTLRLAGNARTEGGRVGEAAADEVGEERGCVGSERLGWLHGAVSFVPVRENGRGCPPPDIHPPPRSRPASSSRRCGGMNVASWQGGVALHAGANRGSMDPGIDETDAIDKYEAVAVTSRRTAMTPTRGTETRELEDVLHDAAGRLSPIHVAALVAHPEAVRSALAAAADALSTGDRERRSSAEAIEGSVPLPVDTEEAQSAPGRAHANGRTGDAPDLGGDRGAGRSQDAAVGA